MQALHLLAFAAGMSSLSIDTSDSSQCQDSACECAVLPSAGASDTALPAGSPSAAPPPVATGLATAIIKLIDRIDRLVALLEEDADSGSADTSPVSSAAPYAKSRRLVAQSGPPVLRRTDSESVNASSVSSSSLWQPHRPPVVRQEW